MARPINTIKFKNGSTIDLVAVEAEKLGSAMAYQTDRELFFPMTDYQKRHLSWWDRFVLWREEMSHRVATALEVLQGKHFCNDDY